MDAAEPLVNHFVTQRESGIGLRIRTFCISYHDTWLRRQLLAQQILGVAGEFVTWAVHLIADVVLG